MDINVAIMVVLIASVVIVVLLTIIPYVVLLSFCFLFFLFCFFLQKVSGGQLPFVRSTSSISQTWLMLYQEQSGF